MEKTQKYIIKQNALTNANAFWQNVETKTEEKVLETAQQFADWVMGQENTLPQIPKIPDLEKNWLNKNTPDFNKAIDLVKKGYSVQDLRNQFKISNKVESELNKI